MTTPSPGPSRPRPTARATAARSALKQRGLLVEEIDEQQWKVSLPGHEGYFLYLPEGDTWRREDEVQSRYGIDALVAAVKALPVSDEPSGPEAA